ncbi:MAG: ABC transporter permease subunit [Lachnospiraceae bacterium]|nr:ABC transporter permease subunit [Lachnospiraceae bacterium]
MYNIIRSLNYNARRDMAVIIALITVIVLPFFVMFVVGQLEGESYGGMTGSVYYITQIGENFIIVMFVILVISCRICASDAGDKTINYEFLSGHNRGSIYWARIIAGIMWSVILTMALFYLPIVALSAVNGWGQELELKYAVIRLLLALLPVIRLSAFFMMTASVLRSSGKGIALGYGFIMVMVILISVLQDVLNLNITWQFAFSNVMYLLSFENSRNIVIDGETVTRFESALPSGMAIGTIVASVAATFIYTYIAYAEFKKKDRD